MNAFFAHQRDDHVCFFAQKTCLDVFLMKISRAIKVFSCCAPPLVPNEEDLYTVIIHYLFSMMELCRTGRCSMYMYDCVFSQQAQ